MPTIVDCPSCARKLRVPDELLGHKVKCPTCETTFEAGVHGSAATPRAEPPPLPPPLPREAPAERDEERRPCPYCGELVRATATRCRHCNERLDDRDEDDDEDENRWRRPVVRRDAEPHRGSLVLVLGIISIVMGVTWILSPVGVFLGIPAWVMGGRDLRKMKVQQMDPRGQGITQAGWICGIIGTIISGLMTLGCVAYIGFVVMMISAMPKAPPPSRTPAPAPLPPPVRRMQAEAAPARLADYLPGGGVWSRGPESNRAQG